MNPYRTLFLPIAVLLGIGSVSGQEQNICRLSPDGVYVLMSNAGASPQQPYENVTGYVVSRAAGNSTRYKEIARVTRPADLTAFKKLAGSELVEQIKEVKNLSSDEALWNYTLSHPSLEDYGFLVLNPKLGVALGAYYLDESIKNTATGTKHKYQVEYLQRGEESIPAARGEVVIGTKTRSSAPQVSKIIESDTLMVVQWKSPSGGNDEVFFANVYRQTGGGGPFEKNPVRIMANRDEDSLYFYWQENVVPEVLYRYCIVPTDLFGNPGATSDTVNVISVNFEATPLLQNVSATDTTGGISIQWTPLPDKAYWTGVMVERSRDSRGNFIVLDTVTAHADRYFDTRAMPNTAYYYRLKAVTIRLDQMPPSAVVSADWKNETLAPMPPSGLKGSNDGPNVKLEWQANSEPDLFAYYVYRGKNTLENMEVISPPLKQTHYLDTANTLDGRSEYIYVVQAVNLSDLTSDFSHAVSVRPLRFKAPPAPQGISGFNEGVRIRLSWPDASELEETVVGYQLYRREIPTGTPPKIPQNFDGLPASVAAGQFGFQLVANVPASYYDDIRGEPGKTYQYVVASIDAVGTESGLSPIVTVVTEVKAIAPPPEIFVRPTSAGIEMEWGTSLQTGVNGYAVYRRSRNDQNPVKLAELPSQQTKYVDSTAPVGNLYFYSVSVLTESGESQRSVEKGGRL